jgi:hypothetical protein
LRFGYKYVVLSPRLTVFILFHPSTLPFLIFHILTCTQPIGNTPYSLQPSPRQPKMQFFTTIPTLLSLLPLTLTLAAPGTASPAAPPLVAHPAALVPNPDAAQFSGYATYYYQNGAYGSCGEKHTVKPLPLTQSPTPPFYPSRSS